MSAAQEIELEQVVLGLQPYVLITVTDMDENDDPLIQVTAGGGIEADVIPEFLAMTAEALGFVPREDRKNVSD